MEYCPDIRISFWLRNKIFLWIRWSDDFVAMLMTPHCSYQNNMKFLIWSTSRIKCRISKTWLDTIRCNESGWINECNNGLRVPWGFWSAIFWLNQKANCVSKSFEWRLAFIIEWNSSLVISSWSFYLFRVRFFIVLVVNSSFFSFRIKWKILYRILDSELAMGAFCTKSTWLVSYCVLNRWSWLIGQKSR